MNCPSCGATLSGKVRFCQECGAFVENLFEEPRPKAIEEKERLKPPKEVEPEPALKKEFNAKTPFDRVSMSLIYENVRLDILNRSDLQHESYVILFFTALIYSLFEVYLIKLPGVDEIVTILFSVALFGLFFLATYIAISIVHKPIPIKIITRMLSYPLLMSTVVLLGFLIYYPEFLFLSEFRVIFIGFLVVINYILGAFVFMPFLRTLLDNKNLKSLFVFTVSYSVTIFALIAYVSIVG